MRAALASTALAAVLLPAAASAPAAKSPLVLATAGGVRVLAADGTRVAAATAAVDRTCDRIVVWDETKGTRAVATYKAGTNCPGSGLALPEYVREIALAGTRVAWVERTAGNEEELTLAVDAPGWKRAQLPGWAANGNGAAGLLDGHYLGDVHGSGALLVYDSWHVCTLVGQPDPWGVAEYCTGTQPASTANGHSADQQALWRLDGGRQKQIGKGTAMFPVVAVDTGRIAVQAADGTVTLLSAAGKKLGTVPVPAGTFTGTALDGTRLATIRDGSLEVYDTETRTLLTATPLAGASSLSGFAGGVVAYTSGRAVHLLRIEDGAEATIAVPGTGAVAAALTSAGLFYSYAVTGATAKGRVAFVGAAELARRLG